MYCRRIDTSYCICPVAYSNLTLSIAGGETEVDKDNISRKGLIFDLSNLPASRVAPIDERNNEPFIKKRLTENDGDVTREGE